MNASPISGIYTETRTGTKIRICASVKDYDEIFNWCQRLEFERVDIEVKRGQGNNFEVYDPSGILYAINCVWMPNEPMSPEVENIVKYQSRRPYLVNNVDEMTYFVYRYYDEDIEMNVWINSVVL